MSGVNVALRRTGQMLLIIGALCVLASFFSQAGWLQFMSNPSMPPLWGTTMSYIVSTISNTFSLFAGVLLAIGVAISVYARQAARAVEPEEPVTTTDAQTPD